MRVKLQSHAYYLLGVRNGSGENQAFRIFNARMAQNFPLAAPRGAKPYQYHAPRIRSGQGHAVHAPRVRKPYAAFLQPFDCRSNLPIQDGI